MRKVLTLLMVLGAFVTPLAIGGCNTIQGAGEDIEEAGEEVQETAQ